MKDSCDRGLAENALHDLGFEQTKNKPHHEKSRIGNFDCISEWRFKINTAVSQSE